MFAAYLSVLALSQYVGGDVYFGTDIDGLQTNAEMSGSRLAQL